MDAEQAILPLEAGDAAADQEKAPLSAEEVVAAYGKLVHAIALAKTASREDADDVFQEVMLAYVRKRPAFDSLTQGRVWFTRATLNCCKQLWRSRKRRETVSLDTAAASLIAREEDRDLLLELSRLPKKDRAVLELTYFGGLSTREIGQVLGCSSGAVRTRLSRARAKLEQKLQ